MQQSEVAKLAKYEAMVVLHRDEICNKKRQSVALFTMLWPKVNVLMIAEPHDRTFVMQNLFQMQWTVSQKKKNMHGAHLIPDNLTCTLLCRAMQTTCPNPAYLTNVCAIAAFIGKSELRNRARLIAVTFTGKQRKKLRV